MLKSFRIGGVHPPENKLSKGAGIVAMPVPETVVIPLSQHIGAPAVPVVAPGEQVKAGQLIGKIPDNSLGAAVHASCDGTVIENTDHSIVIKVGSYV